MRILTQIKLAVLGRDARKPLAALAGCILLTGTVIGTLAFTYWWFSQFSGLIAKWPRPPDFGIIFLGFNVWYGLFIWVAYSVAKAACRLLRFASRG